MDMYTITDLLERIYVNTHYAVIYDLIYNGYNDSNTVIFCIRKTGRRVGVQTSFDSDGKAICSIFIDDASTPFRVVHNPDLDEVYEQVKLSLDELNSEASNIV